MAFKRFVKDNFVLVMGLTLPVLLMAGFMVATSLPRPLSNPPQYDLVFSTVDSPQDARNLPVAVRLVVRDGVLRAQYTKVFATPGVYLNNGWKKLYRFEAKTQKIRALTFGIPDGTDKIEGTREETVEATKGLKLDTALQSPDGYLFTYGDAGRTGLLTDIFWGGRYMNEPRLRKGSASVRLALGDGGTYPYGPAEFVGWVIGNN
jgi:hypothetical protein